MTLYSVYQDGEPTPFDLPTETPPIPSPPPVRPCDTPERRREYRRRAKERAVERAANAVPPKTKICRGPCKLEKPAAKFSRSQYSGDGLRSVCKECEARAARIYAAEHREELTTYKNEWRANNPERARARDKRYREENPEKIKKWRKDCYDRNSEEINDRSRERYADNPEPKRESDRRYYENNREKVNAANRAYYEEHKEETLAYVLQWRRDNPDKVSRNQQKYRREHLEAYALYARLRAARIRNAEGFHTVEDIIRIYDDQEGLCYYCNTPLDYFYHVDHKQPVSKDGSEWPSNLCCACEHCNTSKGDRTEQEFWEILSK